LSLSRFFPALWKFCNKKKKKEKESNIRGYSRTQNRTLSKFEKVLEKKENKNNYFRVLGIL
jgi:hypothetical protein